MAEMAEINRNILPNVVIEYNVVGGG